MDLTIIYKCTYLWCTHVDTSVLREDGKEGGCLTTTQKRFGFQKSKRKWAGGGELVGKVHKAEGMSDVRKEK